MDRRKNMSGDTTRDFDGINSHVRGNFNLITLVVYYKSDQIKIAPNVTINSINSINSHVRGNFNLITLVVYYKSDQIKISPNVTINTIKIPGGVATHIFSAIHLLYLPLAKKLTKQRRLYIIWHLYQ